ncbi:MAG: hypothetical protein FJ225_13730 [Lentisphaerae bacterium]|nr:hypothetical protein [Lentisphaerota bacterium]
MLVVMAIIGLLAGTTLTAVSQVRHAARRAEARDYNDQIVSALKSFLADYRRFPDLTVTTLNTDLMLVLSGQNTNSNTKALRYMEFSSAEWANGEVRDPWGRAYRVAIDNGRGGNDDTKGYDSIVHPQDYSPVRQYAVSWSWGRDGVNATTDDVKSW